MLTHALSILADSHKFTLYSARHPLREHPSPEHPSPLTSVIYKLTRLGTMISIDDR